MKIELESAGFAIWHSLVASPLLRQPLRVQVTAPFSLAGGELKSIVTKSDFYLFCALHSDFDIKHEVNKMYLTVYGGRWVWFLVTVPHLFGVL